MGNSVKENTDNIVIRKKGKNENNFKKPVWIDANFFKMVIKKGIYRKRKKNARQSPET